MSSELDDAEYERLLALSHLKRMSYLMKTIAKRGELWTLARGEEPVVLEEPGSPDAIAVWPDERFARDVLDHAGLGDGAPRRIPLEEWLEEWIPRMRKDRKVVALFPLPSGEGGSLNTWEFEEDIRAELAGPRPLP